MASTDDEQRWSFFNSGSWMWDRRLREHPRYREMSWPGTALRVEGGEVQLVGCLADLSEEHLHRMLPAADALDDAPRPAPPRALRPRRLAAMRRRA